MTKKNELVKINFDKQTCNARDLHKFLEVPSRFNDWIKRRIEEYGFVEGKDYILLTHDRVSGSTTPRDYIVTVDMAKELSMVERTEQGRKSRQYFIRVEREYKRFLRMQTDPARIPHRRENLINNKDFNEAVEEFVKYVEGKSSLPTRYYMIFNDMVNHALFDFPKSMQKIPEKLSIMQLQFSNAARQVVAGEIRSGIKINEDYELIKKTCKGRISKIGEALGVTPIPTFIEQEDLFLIENKS